MKYKTIVIDPPWKYGSWGKSKASHRPNDFTRPMPYPTMKLEEIKDLPIKNLADENCELYLWTTQKYLEDAMQILKYWGFKHCTTITWCKKPMGTGQGGVYCPTTEFLLHGRIGKMPRVKRIDSTWFLTDGWHVWGNQVISDLELVNDHPGRLCRGKRGKKNKIQLL